MKLKAALTLAATLAISTPAFAAINITAVDGTDPYSGPPVTYDFETPGTTPVFSGGSVKTNEANNAEPWPFEGDSFYSVGPDAGSPGTIDLTSFGGISTLSFIWGSIDDYNVLELLRADNSVLATFTGTDVASPASGNQTSPQTNRLVTLTLTGSDALDFGKLRLSSSSNAFEIDNISVGAVPEPATWAMLLLGFGLIGGMMRSRKTRVFGRTLTA